MKLYIARDKDGSLALYYNKPVRIDSKYNGGVLMKGYFESEDAQGHLYLDADNYSEITFENSPQQVELKLCNKNETKRTVRKTK